jgi:hypothetical protein
VTPQLRRSVTRAGRAEDQFARMARLRAMSAADLAATLGGNPAAAAPWV